MSTLYPLKFTPILKDKIWRGNKLNKLLGKPTDSVVQARVGNSATLKAIPQLLQMEH